MIKEKLYSVIKLVCALVITAILMCSCSSVEVDTSLSAVDTEGTETESSSGNQPPISGQVELSGEELEEVKKLLEENGIDESIIDEATRTETGGTLLGSAKPVKQFRTLHDAEEYYDDYFGFHNTIEALPEYSLVGMYCIYDQFLQGIYETEDEKHVVTVKFSKTMDSDELREVYNQFTFVDIVSYNDEIKFACEGESVEEVNLIRFDFPNGKAYTVYSVEAFDRDVAWDIAFELIENLMSMTDWVDAWD